MKSLSKQVEWRNPAGIELTFVPNKRKCKSTWYIDDYCWTAAGHLRNTYDTVPGNISIDPSCVEHSSPILYSWYDAREFYEMSTEKAHSIGLTTFRDDFVGGGGHIHIGVPPWQAVLMLRDMWYRPYVAYACISAYDNLNAEPVHTGAQTSKSFGYAGCKNATKIKTWKAREIQNCYREFTAINIRKVYGTIEWRAFDSAADWDIQELQLALVHRYSQYVMAQGVVDIPKNAELIKSFFNTKDSMVKGFRAFIEDDLVLPWRSYSWMVERNLMPKLEIKGYK